MTKKARIWVGTTFLAIIIFNYIVIGFPLYRKMSSLESRIKVMMIKQVKSGDVLRNSEDSYIIDILKKETLALDRKIVILNCAAVSVVVIIVSWVVFGLIAHPSTLRQAQCHPEQSRGTTKAQGDREDRKKYEIRSE